MSLITGIFPFSSYGSFRDWSIPHLSQMSWSPQMVNPMRESPWSKPRGEHHVSLTDASWSYESCHVWLCPPVFNAFSFLFSIFYIVVFISSHSTNLDSIYTKNMFSSLDVSCLSVQLTGRCGCMQTASLMFSTRVTPEHSCRQNAFSQIRTSLLEVSVSLSGFHSSLISCFCRECETQKKSGISWDSSSMSLMTSDIWEKLDNWYCIKMEKAHWGILWVIARYYQVCFVLWKEKWCRFFHCSAEKISQSHINVDHSVFCFPFCLQFITFQSSNLPFIFEFC